MASRRRLRRREAPRRLPAAHTRADGTPKARFGSEADANRAAFQARLDHGTELVAYPCPYCQGWHLGTAEG